MSVTIRTIGLVACLCAMLSDSRAGAQCAAHWLPGQAVPGVDGGVKAMITWDPDGGGPQAALLVVGGEFAVAGETHARNVAAWNGTQWLALGGGGVFGPVEALAVFNGELVVGGDFTSAGGIAANNIARWNGSTWQPLGVGVNGDVLALHVHNNQLIVGGSFTGGFAYLARWTGSSWFGAGAAFNGPVHALTTHNISGNNVLVAAGEFTSPATRIGWWNGALTWNGFGTGMNNTIESLGSYNGQLIAGGWFSTAGGVSASRIARWTTSGWQALAGGMFNPVEALATFNGQLFAGSFTHFMVWNGAAWSAAATASLVEALQVHNGELYVGGHFGLINGAAVSGIARLNGAQWQAMGGAQGISNTVHALTMFNGELIAGGWFAHAGGVPASDIARWNGTAWQPLGAGTSGPVRALVVHDGELIVGGEFSTAGGVAVNGLARWNGSTWSAMGSVYGEVEALIVHNGELVAAGVFLPPAFDGPYVARWNGTTWTPMGGAFLHTSGSLDDPPVLALVVYQGQLIAAGRFMLPVPGAVARWDGAAWESLTPAINGDVHALASFQGALIAGGRFTNLAPSSSRIAQWTGTSWMGVGGGSGISGIDPATGVYALGEHDEELIVGGLFNSAGPAPTSSNIARWNAFNGWRGLTGGGILALPGGPGDSGVQALAVLGNDLVAAGAFSAAGSLGSWNWARWGGCAPCPADVTPPPNGDNTVNINDLLEVINGWGSCALPCPPRCAADISPIPAGDCQININDLLEVINSWGPCP